MKMLLNNKINLKGILFLISLSLHGQPIAQAQNVPSVNSPAKNTESLFLQSIDQAKKNKVILDARKSNSRATPFSAETILKDTVEQKNIDFLLSERNQPILKETHAAIQSEIIRALTANDTIKTWGVDEQQNALYRKTVTEQIKKLPIVVMDSESSKTVGNMHESNLNLAFEYYAYVRKTLNGLSGKDYETAVLALLRSRTPEYNLNLNEAESLIKQFNEMAIANRKTDTLFQSLPEIEVQDFTPIFKWGNPETTVNLRVLVRSNPEWLGRIENTVFKDRDPKILIRDHLAITLPEWNALLQDAQTRVGCQLCTGTAIDVNCEKRLLAAIADALAWKIIRQNKITLDQIPVDGQDRVVQFEKEITRQDIVAVTPSQHGSYRPYVSRTESTASKWIAHPDQVNAATQARTAQTEQLSTLRNQWIQEETPVVAAATESTQPVQQVQRQQPNQGAQAPQGNTISVDEAARASRQRAAETKEVFVLLRPFYFLKHMQHAKLKDEDATLARKRRSLTSAEKLQVKLLKCSKELVQNKIGGTNLPRILNSVYATAFNNGVFTTIEANLKTSLELCQKFSKEVAPIKNANINLDGLMPEMRNGTPYFYDLFNSWLYPNYKQECVLKRIQAKAGLGVGANASVGILSCVNIRDHSVKRYFVTSIGLGFQAGVMVGYQSMIDNDYGNSFVYETNNKFAFTWESVHSKSNRGRRLMSYAWGLGTIYDYQKFSFTEGYSRHRGVDEINVGLGFEYASFSIGGGFRIPSFHRTRWDLILDQITPRQQQQQPQGGIPQYQNGQGQIVQTASQLEQQQRLQEEQRRQQLEVQQQQHSSH